ncbi:glycosyltransferase family 2 protein [Candidatus Accumulibacter sp. ACC003]|uniref:glycosyltransferase family 2 protein n=1 Tax=Candidatus Accumulibacter sp. ACC003 TaxID=2823334 RepID=UPI0025BBA639|nr:glycosyltransferase family 2 protein [Candidatus Accumulibacter sp. ACC003]
MKLISVVTGCFNEEENVDELYERIRAQFERLPEYDYEHIFIDNASSDATVARIKALAAHDKRVRLIVNTRNFGHIRSPIHALLQARGDAVIAMASDLQEPPELIPDFIARWEQGYRVVAAVKPSSAHTTAMTFIRHSFYATIGRISDTRLIPNYTGFGLYDRKVVEIIRQMDDPYPYFRGLIADIGFEHAEIPFVQPRRIRGISKNNFYTLYDIAILGITSHSKVPIRLATMAGFALSALSLLVAIAYLIYKLVSWEQFSLGIAPVLIGFFFFASVQLFFIGILGEYIAAIHTQVLKRPLVVEKERINFPTADE